MNTSIPFYSKFCRRAQVSHFIITHMPSCKWMVLSIIRYVITRLQTRSWQEWRVVLIDDNDDDDDDGALVSLYSSSTHTQVVRRAAELQQWWHHYFSLVVWRGVKQHFTVVLHYSNSISVISWQWYDGWDETEKAWDYSFTDWMDL